MDDKIKAQNIPGLGVQRTFWLSVCPLRIPQTSCQGLIFLKLISDFKT